MPKIGGSKRWGCSGGPLMLDLFCGLGGASAAMRDAGWRVMRVDIDPRFEADVTADVTKFEWAHPWPVDLLWASPPCEEFTRHALPWLKGPAPSLDLVHAAMRLVNQVKPRFWCIENVRASVPFLAPILGEPQRIGPYMLYGNLPKIAVLWDAPLFGEAPRTTKYSLPPTEDRKAKRAFIDRRVSEAVRIAVERAIGDDHVRSV